LPRKSLIGLLVVLFVVQGFLSDRMFPAWKENYSAGNLGARGGLSPDQLLASLAGLRQMVAGILWVRSDTYFHEGQFDAILPIIRLVTWLNPRQIEVYATGAWHIGYNFTDEQNRSDRRYIPLALRLLEEGTEANPDTFRLFHETGWMYYHKVEDDYDKAVKWFEISTSKSDVMPALRTILSSAYQRAGQLDKAMDYMWKIQEEFAQAAEKSKDPFDYSNTLRDTAENNLDNFLVRMASRGVFAKKDGVYDQFRYDTQNPVDLAFTVKIQVLEPKVIRVSGTWGIPTTGARIRLVIRDSDYNLKWDPAPTLDFEFDRDKTYMQDSLYTQNGRFDRKIDMSRNPTMYPFKSENYIVEFYFSPRNAPPHIQDKIGWNGEGMTDKRFLEQRHGAKVLLARFEMNRDMFLKRGDYALGYIFRSPGYVDAPTQEESDVIIRRSLRGMN
jgi:hypothetical protein